jgi:hypothetical protein
MEPEGDDLNQVNLILIVYIEFLMNTLMVLREILQNSDDAKSTEQIFILDHNTYPSVSPIKNFYPDIFIISPWLL